MSSYFSNFPTVVYDGTVVTDITRRANFIQTNLSNPFLFLPYTVKDGEKPEDIAHAYYGTVDATWLILMSNGIIDPYSQWPMSEETFSAYLMKKYKQLSNRAGYNIVAWTQDETRFDNIYNYCRVSENGKTISVSPQTFDSFKTDSDILIDSDVTVTESNVALNWVPYRYYEYERDMNNNKREILVVESSYYNQIEKEFKVMIRSS